MFDALLTADGLIALATLAFLEIVLGVDNIIFISIIADKLPKEQQAKARNIGLLLALVFRVALLFGITTLMKFTQTLFTIDFDILKWSIDHPVSGRDLILFLGGLFLIAKSTSEINHKMEAHEESTGTKKPSSLSMVIFQIILLDIVFSFDSILTAVGLTQEIIIMVIAVCIAIGIMMAFAGKVSAFINKYPSLQILALAFLILIGFTLIVEGLHVHLSKGFIYFAVVFSLGVEAVNIKVRNARKKV